MNNITVYSRPACAGCTKVKKLLDTAGLEYDVIDIEVDEDARNYLIHDVKAAAVPVIEADGYPRIVGYKARDVAAFILKYKEELEVE